MNTLLNLLSAAAVVATGAFASTAPQDAEVRALPTSPQPFALSAKILSPHTALQSPVFQSNGQWLTISEDRRAPGDASQDAPTQRWIF